MKKLNYILILMMGLFLFNACEEDTFIKDIENGENLAVFSNSTKSVLQVANGEEYTVEVPMKIEGPSALDLTGDFVITVEDNTEGIPDASKAVEGTHYRIDENQITLSKDTLGNYEGVFEFTMLTQGLVAPLDNSPKLNLTVTDVSGDGNVITTAKPLPVTLNYACPSNIQGEYSLAVTGWNGTEINPSEEIVKTGIGTYETQSVEYFFPDGTRGGYLAQGLIFTDVCGSLNVPAHGLGATYSNQVSGTQEGDLTGDPETEGGVTSFTLYYSVEGLGDFEAEYTYLGPLE